MAIKIVKVQSNPPRIYKFGKINEVESNEVLGGKGAGLANMVALGVTVPPGFTIPCDISVRYQKRKSEDNVNGFLTTLMEQVAQGCQYLEDQFDHMPLVSVRSGARVSMPGMMDTILNVGLTSANLPEWEERIGARAARDSYRRLIQMYGSVAMGINMATFEAELSDIREQAGVKTDAELNEDHLSRLITRYQKIFAASGAQFPDTFEEQLVGSIRAVFDSWDNPRAIEWRKLNAIPDDWGTAVTVQAMVFGNFNEKSCSGVLFSRNPSTGEAIVMGDWLAVAQGEDVVAGIRDPEPFEKMITWSTSCYEQLKAVAIKLENHLKDAQDIEFTVQDGKVYILQCRTAKRSARAAFKIAYELVAQGLIDKATAVSRVNRAQLMATLTDTIDPSFTKPPTLKGLPAGGGLVSGIAVFNSVDAVNCTQPCILIREETDPDDIAGMNSAVGILTATGGFTSHAAVVARGMNKTCVVGATDLSFSGGKACIKGHYGFAPGSKVTLDGATGNVWVNVDVPVIEGKITQEAETIIGWATEIEGAAVRLDVNGSMKASDIAEVLGSLSTTRLLVDLAALEYGAHSPAAVANLINFIGDKLYTVVGLQDIYVDLTPLAERTPKVDLAFSKMFGGKAGDTAQAFYTGLMGWPSVWATGTTLIGVNIPVPMRLALKKHGYKLAGAEIKTFADLLTGTSGQASESVIDSVFGGQEAYQEAITMIEKVKGKSPVIKVPVPKYWYEAIKE